MAIGRRIGVLHGAGAPTLVPDSERPGAPCAGVDERERRSARCADPNEIDRLHRALAEVTPKNHPRTCDQPRGSGTRCVAGARVDAAASNGGCRLSPDQGQGANGAAFARTPAP